ncbi:MAG TPA: dTMP kinase [Methylibium sp.]|uniref:dTMP kinase n=1 Tax=Methylibium sp. TaxID=2067992 RepID=UPI002DB9B50F|nr:dTMP kinase [Methylibium sp.]HEU4460616.1 dTMP kinase [Methylibium sp.]
MTGGFISFEGIDGAGKSTHIEAIAERLRERGHIVLRSREPGGTPLAETLRELVLHRPMDALTEALLIFAARRDHLLTTIEPALARGELVLCDRFTDASFAYQGAGRGFDLAVLRALESWVQSNPSNPGELRQPHLTLWFDLDPAIAAERVARARDKDRFEQQDLAFFTRVRDGYLARLAAEPARFVRIDADAAREVVGAQIDAALRARGW